MLGSALCFTRLRVSTVFSFRWKQAKLEGHFSVVEKEEFSSFSVSLQANQSHVTLRNAELNSRGIRTHKYHVTSTLEAQSSVECAVLCNWALGCKIGVRFSNFLLAKGQNSNCKLVNAVPSIIQRGLLFQSFRQIFHFQSKLLEVVIDARGVSEIGAFVYARVKLHIYFGLFGSIKLLEFLN